MSNAEVGRAKLGLCFYTFLENVALYCAALLRKF